MMTAVVSLLTGIKIDPTIAMTGEATLRGAVLAVGGIKEKVLAAHRAGIKTILMPEQCGKDLIDVPEEIKNELEFVLVSKMEEVLHRVLGEDNLKAKKSELMAKLATEAEAERAKKDSERGVSAKAQA
jgi:ATP-dependent Lon protease